MPRGVPWSLPACDGEKTQSLSSSPGGEEDGIEGPETAGKRGVRGEITERGFFGRRLGEKIAGCWLEV